MRRQKKAHAALACDACKRCCSHTVFAWPDLLPQEYYSAWEAEQDEAEAEAAQEEEVAGELPAVVFNVPTAGQIAANAVAAALAVANQPATAAPPLMPDGAKSQAVVEQLGISVYKGKGVGAAGRKAKGKAATATEQQQKKVPIAAGAATKTPIKKAVSTTKKKVPIKAKVPVAKEKGAAPAPARKARKGKATA